MMNEVKSYMLEVGQRARHAALLMARAESAAKDRALLAAAEAIDRDTAKILSANQQDMASAQDRDLDTALLDRLELNRERVIAMADGLRQIAALPDPVGAIQDLNY